MRRSTRDGMIDAPCRVWLWLTWLGWLFTIGFSDLNFWGAVLAFVFWPSILGATLARLVW